MQTPFIGKASVPVPSGAAQISTLLRRKELPRLTARPLSCTCSVLLPVALCSLVVLGTKLSGYQTGGGESLAPQNIPEALYSLVGIVGAVSMLNTAGNVQYSVANRTPAAIPTLGEYLRIAQCTPEYAGLSKAWPPFNGAILAVAPDTPLVRQLMARVLAGPLMPNVTEWSDLHAGREAADGLDEAAATVGAKRKTGQEHEHMLRAKVAAAQSAVEENAAAAGTALSSSSLTVRYFESESHVESKAKAGLRIWAAVIVDNAPPSNWSYTLRFPDTLNNTGVPSTRKLVDRFAPGLSSEFVRYYATGFLSLQSAIDKSILANASGAPLPPRPTPTHDLGCGRLGNGSGLADAFHGLGAAAMTSDLLTYAMPYPVPTYTHSKFFDHAGSLIGLIVVLSFLIPLSTMLRSVVLERETKLREQLLMMGTTLSAYYTSLAITHASTFLIISLFSALALIVGGTFVYSSPALVVAFFLAFGLAALAFAASLTPFFRNAKVASLVGPLALFISAQLIFFFLQQGTGVLAEGMAGGKTLASLLPACAFYLGANRLALYEGSGQAITFANVFEGEFSFGSSIVL